MCVQPKVTNVATCWFPNIMDSIVYNHLLRAQAKKKDSQPMLVSPFFRRDGL